MKRLVFIAALAIMITGCSGKPANSANGNNPPNPVKPANTPNDPASVAPAAPGSVKIQSGTDFSTPKATVETFIKAAERRDIDVLSQCFDPQSAGEFKSLREKTASPDDLDKLADQVGDGLVLDTTEKGDVATVKAKFPMGMEEVSLKHSAAGWKIVDF